MPAIRVDISELVVSTPKSVRAVRVSPVLSSLAPTVITACEVVDTLKSLFFPALNAVTTSSVFPPVSATSLVKSNTLVLTSTLVACVRLVARSPTFFALKSFPNLYLKSVNPPNNLPYFFLKRVDLLFLFLC